MTIQFDDFAKVEMKVGEIREASLVEGSEKLLKLSVDFGEENPRTIMSGIKNYFESPDVLVGKRCAFVTNLEPRSIMGVTSEAMILAASHDGKIALFEVGENIPVGTKIK